MKNILRVAYFALLLIFGFSIWFSNSQPAIAAEESVDNYADLCLNRDGLIWNTDNPLPLMAPCIIPGEWVAVAFGPNAEPYQTTRFGNYYDLTVEAEAYDWGTVWFEPNYSLLCTFGYAFGWNENNPLRPLAPCPNPGTWGAADFAPSTDGYEAKLFEGYQALLQEAEGYTSGLIWFQADFSALCSNQDGIIWNSNNPLPPMKPCSMLGEWVAVAFGPNDGSYETQRFGEYQALLDEAAKYEWGTVWFEEATQPVLQNQVYLPFVAGPPGETLCRQGERSASCGLPVPEPRN